MDEEDLLKKKNKEDKEPTVQIPVIKAYELLREMSYNSDDMEVVPKKKQSKIKTFLSKKSYKYGMGFAVLLIAIFGVSYSYFNYTKIDSRQADIAAGEVYVRLVENERSITLSKMYPRTDEEARSRNDNYFDFTIKAKNTSTGRSVLYTLNINNGEDMSGKTRINPQYIKVDLQEKVNNEYVYLLQGVKLTEYEYMASVPTNTTSEITREYRLRIWISDALTINDSNGSYTEAQFANLFANFNITVNSEDKETALDIITKNVSTETTINFADISSDSNGKGLNQILSTQDDTYPIYYYRGNIKNNNVIFGGYCWQIVRTTETGGIKMIYNGEPEMTGSGDSITYNCGNTRSLQNSVRTRLNLSHSTGYYYADDYEVRYRTGNSVTYRLKSKDNPITSVPITSSNASTNISNIVSNYRYTCKKTTANADCEILYKVDSYSSGTYAYVYASTNISTIGTGQFNNSSNSVSDVGYMYNEKYDFQQSVAESGSIYGKNIEWDGNNYLVIENDAGVGSTNNTLDDNHHYSCGTSGITYCSSVRYYYGTYYIVLSHGETVEDALYKMTGNGSDVVKLKNSSYELNFKNSTIKGIIDLWFKEYLTNEVNQNNIDYQQYIEDTVYCNDRSYKTTDNNSSYSIFSESGWNPVGGNLSNNLHFGSLNRIYNNWYSTTNVPSMSCPNDNDKFTVSNSLGNGALTYPVGLLTADEVILAGGQTMSNINCYLYIGFNYWTMTPKNFQNNFANSFYGNGGTNSNYVTESFGVRPVISLKLGTGFESGGDGTPTNPYIVKYNS